MPRKQRIRTSEYVSWSNMIQRCYDSSSDRFLFYGAKGITVCERWRSSFMSFLEDVGPKPTNLHTLDRFPDRSGNYEPGNVRWATCEEQQNNRSNNHIVTIDGISMTLARWSKHLGVNYSTVRTRIQRGQSERSALGL